MEDRRDATSLREEQDDCELGSDVGISGGLIYVEE